MQELAYTKEWIRQLRQGMRQEKFCKHIYVFRKNGSVCCNIHRNTLGNWETGKTSLPRDVETFLSLALWEYDHVICASEIPESAETWDIDTRNRRYQHARTRLQKMLGVDLYCRNLHDAVLIQVTRGILTFEEVPAFESRLEQTLAQTVLTTEERNLYAIERNTVSISSDLGRVNSREELETLLTVIHRNSFASANRIIGARLKKIYESRERYPKKVSLERAIANFAPNYRNSYVRMFTSSFISRSWLLDLCVHLKFDGTEINTMLEAAHMAEMTDGEWNRLQDSNASFLDMSVVDRFKIMLILGGYVRQMGELPEFPQAEHLLEAFSIYEQGAPVIVALDRLIEEEGNGDRQELEFDGIWAELEETQAYQTWFSYVELEDAATSLDEVLQRVVLIDCKAYSDLNQRRMRQIADRGEVGLICFLVAMGYSVFMGRKYEGVLTEQDLQQMKKLFDMEDDLQRFIYSFLSTMFGIFLGKEEIEETGQGGFCVYNPVTQKRTRALDLDRILNNMFEAVVELG